MSVLRLATDHSLRSQHEISDWAERILTVTPPDEEALIIGLTWAAHRYQQTQDHDAYERLVYHYGAPDHPLIRYARAYVVDDDDALVELAPRAVAELRRLGEDHLAEHTEIHATGPLLTAGVLRKPTLWSRGWPAAIAPRVHRPS